MSGGHFKEMYEGLRDHEGFDQMNEPVIVIGAGHAGCEAALASARLGW